MSKTGKTLVHMQINVVRESDIKQIIIHKHRLTNSVKKKSLGFLRGYTRRPC